MISIASDSEAQASTVTLMRTSPTLEDDRVGDYRRDLVRRLMFQMMNVRFGELARKADAPFLGAGTGEDTITAKSSATTLGAQAEDGRILDALRAMIVEARRARQFGFSEFELEQGRRRLLSFYETAVAEKGKTESASYADEYIRNFLTGEPFPGIQAEYDMSSDARSPSGTGGITTSRLTPRSCEIGTIENPWALSSSMMSGSAATVCVRSPPLSCSRTTCPPPFLETSSVFCTMFATPGLFQSPGSMPMPIV